MPREWNKPEFEISGLNFSFFFKSTWLLVIGKKCISRLPSTFCSSPILPVSNFVDSHFISHETKLNFAIEKPSQKTLVRIIWKKGPKR